MSSEMRLAMDGNAYTREEFLAFYGQQRGESKWAAAAEKRPSFYCNIYSAMKRKSTAEDFAKTAATRTATEHAQHAQSLTQQVDKLGHPT